MRRDCLSHVDAMAGGEAEGGDQSGKVAGNARLLPAGDRIVIAAGGGEHGRWRIEC